jgi:hypothetical protein
VNPAGERNWRLIALGMVASAVLLGYAVVRPGIASGREALLAGLASDVHQAVEQGDPAALGRARERLFRSSHRDLLGQETAALLRLVTTLEEVTPSCAADRVGSAFERGTCLVWRGRYEDALIAFSRVSAAEGGAAGRELTVRLLHDRALALAPAVLPRSEQP